ncbi:Hydrolase of the alpha/beta superfamily [Hahella chejuensis KCTC 2396]|uniref:Hydrolase of the alpha/beta superfamily n=2 Tax=Hahella chejuensis TaxID=158327 RepID=Q2SC65_HAHCH|nr:Hydrolase of the alpha/beta superfamily [Hahella chejuensis KCTC 2396]
MDMQNLLPIVQQEPVQFSSQGDELVGRLFLPAREGRFPAAIICHGAFGYKEHFYELAEALAHRGIAALALDMRGHGESEGPRFHVNMQAWRADVAAALEYLKSRREIESHHIGALGFSSGGTAVLEAAAQGASLRALVTLSATVRNVLTWWQWPFFKTANLVGAFKRRLGFGDLRLPLAFALKSVPAAVDPRINASIVGDPYLVQAYSGLPIPGAIECFIVDTFRRTKNVQCPVCVIHGAEDRVDPPASAKLLYDNLRGSKALHIVADSGHVGHMDKKKGEIIQLTCDWFADRL